jgi:hypothetical protein
MGRRGDPLQVAPTPMMCVRPVQYKEFPSVFVALQRSQPAIDRDRFHHAADQLDIAERFAGLFRAEPQFETPANVLAEPRRSCPDLLG